MKKLQGKSKRKHNRNINDVALYDLLNKIRYKCGWYGSTNHKIDRYASTTKRCWNILPDDSICGYEWKEPIATSIRKLRCPMCNALLDRDLNASRGIMIIGLRDQGWNEEDIINEIKKSITKELA